MQFNWSFLAKMTENRIFS